MVLKGQEERTAVVRSITTQYLSFSLASSDASGAETKATLRGNPAELPLLHALRARGSCPPYAWGMLKNKHIPFRKWESKRFGIIDSVHKRCSSGWKGQVTMQFQYSGCFNCLFFLLFFALSISTQTFVYKSFGLKLLKFSHNGQENCPLEGSYMYQDPCMLFFFSDKSWIPSFTLSHKNARVQRSVHGLFAPMHYLVCSILRNWTWLWVGAGISCQHVFIPGPSVLFPYPDVCMYMVL